MDTPGNDPQADDVVAARGGDRAALERIVRAVQPQVYGLALRFFGDPRDAEDAAQEALIQVVTKLDRFRGESALSTWVYRVATNKFLSMARGRGERAALTLDEFDDELARVPAARRPTPEPAVDDHLLLEEVKVGCTLAMLLGLDRDHRMAYILGEIVELDHHTAAEVLEITPAAYRKRLQRARERVTNLMRARCGLFDEANACRCRVRAPAAIERGCVDPHSLVFATSATQARRFPAVLHEIRRLEVADRAAAIYRSHPEGRSRTDVAGFVRDLLAS